MTITVVPVTDEVNLSWKLAKSMASTTWTYMKRVNIDVFTNTKYIGFPTLRRTKMDSKEKVSPSSPSGSQ